MPRRVQDIIPNSNRSIRNIPLERSSIIVPLQPPKKKLGSSILAQMRQPEEKTNEHELEPRNDTRKKTNFPEMKMPIMPPRKMRKSGAKKWLFLLMSIVVIIAIAGYIASVYFSRASFVIVPKTVPFSVNSTYISQSTQGKGVLMYELASIKGDSAVTVPATDGPKISTSAKGKITIYNNFSVQSQRLIAGTRFADDKGRVYRLSSSVVVPGYNKVGSTITPGTLSASVVADQAGESYNITKIDPISDFKIVAYKGNPKYESIYGRLATDITGGFMGTKKTINPAVLASTTATLQSKIVSDLLAKLKTSVPDGYIMYPNAYVPIFSAPVIGGTDPRSATVTLQGTVYGILFERSGLVARVAGEQSVAIFDDFSYETPGLDSLDFSIANIKDFSPEKKNTLIIKLKGDAMLVGTIPINSLKTKLAGLSLAETSSVLRSFKSVIEIEKSSGYVTPPWSKVPSNPDRITIEVLTK
ncbi:MAG: hypothetical protein A3C79_00750 [Candidatus Taylorbacteria bacterium RIFCSPHIGHO2_02_FULL_45_28]|uniref:Baseplate protein J-like domain-containing protein n=1 Tax=Candidatus Taylorbacteria bacterium RIFCSPHIGHO2_12_FULL_45_16 TaxID=1802315 RepID=A0A1G2MZA7_9BACT|nr:MAG: hypothetical protein A2830_02005 [Candidatus Taylorbacteria bacterium RIFCSPHIGHO2_01_FULL_44_110]OHA25549.1 MAG: hypothetical protein A3C79_00750 [Candidatus Taylorbacteria bacterium RIFCSPHIGHO2_02_FULL_45_28]OHA29216.1 MAG: hypothetical protein A3F51_01215 [Candidatus Taylorbacteria bacterium RIFCSPHIGHO2_12_FULL_45_16]OHA33438.1 MAG: hypothetical protein A3A23_02095 [Candidatus Taylorbacteria bacterium RIFCSPLOWO2_01_FULL_45_59]OHA39231.1 MAG: hypothetical protein A3I98_02190 [Candi